MSKATERSEPANWPLVLVLVLSGVGGLATAVLEFVDMPVSVGLLALSLLFGGALVALFLAYREARTGEVSVPRAIGRALKTGIRWFFFFV